MRLIFSIILVIGFASCSLFNKPPKSSNEIEVVGTASNAKYGAIVVTEQDTFYYIDGLREWPDHFYKEKVKVNGTLEVIIYDVDTTQIRQGLLMKFVIRNPKYELYGPE